MIIADVHLKRVSLVQEDGPLVDPPERRRLLDLLDEPAVLILHLMMVEDDVKVRLTLEALTPKTTRLRTLPTQNPN